MGFIMMVWIRLHVCLLTVEVSFIQDLRLYDLLDDVLQRDDARHLVEGVALTLVVHPLHDGEVGLP